MSTDIPFRDYPAKQHAANVAKYLQANHLTEKYGDESNHPAVVIYLEAQKTRMIEDSDEAVLFRYCSCSCPFAPGDPALLTR